MTSSNTSAGMDSDMRAPARSDDAPSAEPLPRRQLAIAACLALALIVAMAAAVRYTELMTGKYISTGVPPLSALLVLFLMAGLRPFLRRLSPRLAPSGSQILAVYAMMTVAVILVNLSNIRAFLPHLVALQYWGGRSASSRFSEYASSLPAWYAPRDPEAIRHYYEGAPGGAIPWGAWAVPLAVWGGFFIAMFIGIFSMVTLVHRQWVRNEKLSFPLLTIPLAMASEEAHFRLGGTPMRRSLFLIGFGIAAAFNALNVLHLVYPPMPRIGFREPIFRDALPRPWTPLQGLQVWYNLEAIGIGYFVPLEITFSIWFFFLAQRALAVYGSAIGYEEAGWPFPSEMSSGGYFAFGLILLWGLRRTLRESLARAFGCLRVPPEVSTERWAWIGLGFSALFVVGFCTVAGMAPVISLPFLATVALWALVYARIRAETGVPYAFVFPMGMTSDIFVNTAGVSNLLGLGGLRSLVLLTSFNWMNRYDFPFEQAGYQMDASKLGEEIGLARKRLFAVLLAALAVGLAAAIWCHLSAYYFRGSNLVPSAATIGEYRERVAQEAYGSLAARIGGQETNRVGRAMAAGGGFVFVGVLSILRMYWLRCPLHPLGFLISTATGETSSSWMPLFIAWACKAVILHVGGLRLYRAGIPLFLGLAIGHFLIGGILWPVLGGMLLPYDASKTYHVVFGES